MPAEQYPADWDERRKKVYQRDGYECQSCGAQGGQAGDTELHAHHETPISEGGSHDLDNLVTLCKGCHNDQHDHDITADSDDSATVNRLDAWFTKWARIVFLPGLYAAGTALIISKVTEMGWPATIGGHILVALVGIAIGWYFPKKVVWGYGINIGIGVAWIAFGEPSIEAVVDGLLAASDYSGMLAVVSVGYFLFFLTIPLFTVLAVRLGLHQIVPFSKRSLFGQ